MSLLDVLLRDPQLALETPTFFTNDIQTHKKEKHQNSCGGKMPQIQFNKTREALKKQCKRLDQHIANMSAIQGGNIRFYRQWKKAKGYLLLN